MPIFTFKKFKMFLHTSNKFQNFSQISEFPKFYGISKIKTQRHVLLEVWENFQDQQN